MSGEFDAASGIADWMKVRRLLCVRLDTIGDVLMTTPAIRALRESLPVAHITLLTSSSGAQVATLIPLIDTVITYDVPWMKHSPQGDCADITAGAALLREQGFDGAVIFCTHTQSPLPAAMLCYMAGIPRCLAYCRENPYRLISHRIGEHEPDRIRRHEVRRQLELVRTIGCVTNNESLCLSVPAQVRTAVASLLARYGLYPHGTWIVVHPGASAPSRRYAPDKFAAVADAVHAEYGYTVVFTGSAQEEMLIETIRSQMRSPSVSLAGLLDIGMLAALIESAPLLITNNTGPAHMAAALNTRVVDLYALTNLQHTPWTPLSRVLSYDVPCKNCYRSICPEGHNNCLTRITPAEVVAAAGELLAGR